MFRSVDLPLPDGPSRTTSSSRRSSKSTPRSAWTSTSPILYVFARPRASSTTSVMGHQQAAERIDRQIDVRGEALAGYRLGVGPVHHPIHGGVGGLDQLEQRVERQIGADAAQPAAGDAHRPPQRAAE